jgi:dihydroneopterin aldolase
MSALLTISLDRLRFFAFHGLYHEERKTGNHFELSLSVAWQPASGTITGISDTINYASLYELLKIEMKRPRDLLETFAMETVEKIHMSFPLAHVITLAITKLQPPIAGLEGTTTVTFTKEFL